MKLILCLIIICIVTNNVNSESGLAIEDPPILYIFVDKLPKFNYEGGLNEYVFSNIELPFQGQMDASCTVLISFVINKEGKIEKIHIEKGIVPDFNKEVIRVFESMPLWIPGEKDSKPVDVIMFFPIDFKLKGKKL